MTRWVPIDTHLCVTVHDSVLPYKDRHQDQRRQELQDKKLKYELESKLPGYPKMVRNSNINWRIN